MNDYVWAQNVCNMHICRRRMYILGVQCTCVNTIQERDGRTPHDSLDYTMRSIVWRKMNFTQCNGAVHQATSLFIVVV